MSFILDGRPWFSHFSKAYGNCHCTLFRNRGLQDGYPASSGRMHTVFPPRLLCLLLPPLTRPCLRSATLGHCWLLPQTWWFLPCEFCSLAFSSECSCHLSLSGRPFAPLKALPRHGLTQIQEPLVVEDPPFLSPPPYTLCAPSIAPCKSLYFKNIYFY